MRRPNAPGVNETTPLVTATEPGVQAGDRLLVAGEGFFSTYDLSAGELVIGRGDGCDVQIEHKALSRRHAVLRGGPPATIQDLGSTNGTRVAGELRKGGEPVKLAAADSFHIGPFSFVLVARAPGEERSLSGRDVLRVIDPTPKGVPALLKDVAASKASVLILGETGVGKEVLAETLHLLSARTGELTRINCAALSESLLESELFGHEKGAFTGAAAQKVGLLEAADGGTVFLDEVGELPLSIQAKLLRAVEHREVMRIGSTRPIQIDVRFLSATNRDLPAEVASGAFRRDLFFRLDGVTLVIPPLRERRALVGTLAMRFLDEARKKTGQPAKLSAEVLGALEEYSWPGNVRELKAVIERAVLLSRGGEIGVKHLSFARRPDSSLARAGERTTEPPPVAAPPVATSAVAVVAAAAAAAGGENLDFLDDEQKADRTAVMAALDECAGNQTRAAKKLGIARTTLVTKLRLYRIPRPRT
ncbi:MAG TPA: sigma 54-interacting transcriptional regulator [Kofleriaceae bacterium]|nr:sigma 54-interacting transcriptional regulator [Kofleriaceae bacterium]